MAGYTAIVEEVHLRAGRRVDVAVQLPSGHKVAIEVQDSKINVDTMKKRMKIDLSLGYIGTVWVFTSNRLPDVTSGPPDAEARVPDELRWVTNRTGQPVSVLDTDSGRLYSVSFQSVIRFGGTYHDSEGNEYAAPDVTLKSMKGLAVCSADFKLSPVKGKYARPGSPDWVVVFDARPQDVSSPWTVKWLRGIELVEERHFIEPPLWNERRENLVLHSRGCGADTIQLEHNASRRIWVLRRYVSDQREVTRWVAQ